MGNITLSALNQSLVLGGLLLGSLLCNVACAQVLGSTESEANATSDAFEAALLEYERCHWATAWESLARLANRGHPLAARLALDMQRFGPRLFGGTFRADSAQLAAWEESSRSG